MKIITVQAMNVRLNELKLSTPPHHYATPRNFTPTVSIPGPGRHSWCGMNVTVINHPWYKGKPAVIKDILLRQSTASGIKLDLQLSSYDPTAPYQRILVDSTDVINAQYVHSTLINVSKPYLHDNTRTWTQLGLEASKPVSEDSRRPPVRECPAGCATPMPTSSFETPAWNPSSATLTWAPTSLPISSRQTCIPEPLQPLVIIIIIILCML